MILNVLIFRNKKIGCFTQPQFSDVEPEKAAIQLARSLKINEDEVIAKKYADLEMFEIGTFDDEKGICDWHQPRLLLVCADALPKKEVIDDGTSIPSVGSKESA